jgi:hypothetical protein
MDSDARGGQVEPDSSIIAAPASDSDLQIELEVVRAELDSLRNEVAALREDLDSLRQGLGG